MAFFTDLSPDDFVFLQYMDSRVGIQITEDDNLILHLQSARTEVKLLKRHGPKIRISIEAGADVEISKEEHNQHKRRK